MRAAAVTGGIGIGENMTAMLQDHLADMAAHVTRRASMAGGMGVDHSHALADGEFWHGIHRMGGRPTAPKGFGDLRRGQNLFP